MKYEVSFIYRLYGMGYKIFVEIRNKTYAKYEILGGGGMNKKTVALTNEQYEKIIETIRNGFICSDGHIVKPNYRIATVLSLEANLGLRISDILQLRLSAIIHDGNRYRLNIVEKKTKKNQFKSFQMKENENGEIICPAGHAFTLVSSTLDHRSMYPKTNQKYVNEHCGDCPLRSRCTKARKGRTLNRSRDMEKYHKEVRKNLESEEGKKIMMQRSI